MSVTQRLVHEPSPRLAADPAPARAAGFYLPQLDILRLFAFLAVFVQHDLPSWDEKWIELGASKGDAHLLTAVVHAGGFGVDLFFALSAYLIGSLLLKEKAAFGRLDIKGFYIRRALRIWPLYFAALILFFAWQTIVPHERLSAGAFAAFLVFGGNWVCVLGGFPLSAASPLWSVCVEEQFYLTAPWALARLSRAQLRWLALGALLLSVAVRAWLCASGASHPAVWCNTFARLDPIALGLWLAAAPEGMFAKVRPGWLLTLGVAGVAAAGVVDGLWTDALAPVFTYLAAALAATAIVLAVVALPAPPKGFGWATHLGKVSYGLYVFHLGAIRLFDAYAPENLAGFDLWRIVVPMAVSIGLALASYAFFEKPFLRLKTRFEHVASRPA